MKNVVFLQENSYFNEINVFQRMQKEYEKIFKKHAKMLQKIYINSFKNQLRKKNAKMTPKCSKTYPKRRPKIYKMSTKIEVQKFMEKT